MQGPKQPHAQNEVSKHAFEFVEQAQKEHGSGFDMQDELAHRANLRLIRRREVEDRTGLSRSTIYEWMKQGRFPQPVKLGTRLVAWRESDIAAWLESRETRAA